MTRLATVTSPRARYWSREYRTTSPSPMIPASSPRWRLSVPSVAEICWLVSTRNDTGNAPYFSWLAREVADACVKLPVICACPVGMAACVEGAEITRLSRTIAKRFRVGSVSFNAKSRWVTSPNFLAPALEKVRFTCQDVPVKPWLFVSRLAVAPVTSVPETSAGPRMYFSVPSSAHDTYGFFGSGDCARSALNVSCLLQSSAVNWSSIFLSIQLRSL